MKPMQMQPQLQNEEIQTTVPANVVKEIEQAQVDVQIATAHAYPRKRDAVLRNIINEALQDPGQMLYVLKYTGEDGVHMVEGPSIRLAEIIAQQYGNLRVAAQVTESRPEYIRAKAFAWDLESNSCVAEEVTVPTLDRRGQPYKERLRIIHQQVAISKALRNAILRIVPRSIVAAAVASIKRSTTVDPRSLAKLKQWLDAIGVSEEQACRVVGAQSLASMTTEQLSVLRGLANAIKEGDMTVAEAFGLESEPQTQSQTQKAPSKSKGPVAPKDQSQDQEKQSGEPKAYTIVDQEPQPVASGPVAEPAREAQPEPKQAESPQASVPQPETLLAVLQEHGVTREMLESALEMIGMPSLEKLTPDDVERLIGNAEETANQVKRLNAIKTKKPARKASKSTSSGSEMSEAQPKTQPSQPSPADPTQETDTTNQLSIDDLLI